MVRILFSFENCAPPMLLFRATQKMVNELTEEEQELAARTSYAYWTASELKRAGCPSDDVRTRMAMREARRHLVGEGNYDKGLIALRACCAFRKVSLK